MLAFVTTQLVFGHTQYSHFGEYSHLGATHEMLLFVGTLPAWVLVARLQGLYRHDEERADHSTADDLLGVFYLVTIGSWTVFVSTELSGLATPSTLRVSFFWGLAITLVTAARGAARTFSRRHSSFVQKTVIVGAGGVGQLVAKKLGQHPEYGLELVGFVDANPMDPRPDLDHLTVLGGPDELALIIREHGIERVVIAFPNEAETDTVELIRTLKDFDVQIDIVPRFFDILGPGFDVHTIEGLPLLGVPPLRLSRSSKLLKWAMDIALPLVALFFLAPLFALIALLIKRDSPGPVFFRQERMGADEETFRIFKFQTMSVDAEGRKHEVGHLNQHLADDPRMFKIHDDPRVTRIGRVLRRTSLDELPQLLNVIKGGMSLVGPRPLILRRGPARARLGTQAPRPEARHDRPLAGTGAERDPVRGDGQARLHVRDVVVAGA